MDQKFLVINPGSTSKKLGLYSHEDRVIEARFETLAKSEYRVGLKTKTTTTEKKVSKAEFKQATFWVIDYVRQSKLLESLDDLTAVGLRVVAPGTALQQHQRIDDDYVELLQEKQNLAPLHIRPVLQEIHLLQTKYPQLPLFAVSDSAVHSRIPTVARNYGINHQDTQKWDIHRFGYHGISISSLISQLDQMCQPFPEKVVLCHLGGGASITAVRNGVSVDTSMGLTPLEGLLMNTRGGDLDDGALIYLAKRSGMNFDALENYLNTECGLYGVSGETGDVPQLLALEAQGHHQAHLALEMFLYRVRKYIGSYVAALNGVDVLVFSATIGERSGIIRQRICQGLNNLGVWLDDDKNFSAESGSRWIHQDGAPLGIAVIPTDEMGQMARIVSDLIEKA